MTNRQAIPPAARGAGGLLGGPEATRVVGGGSFGSFQLGSEVPLARLAVTGSAEAPECGEATRLAGGGRGACRRGLARAAWAAVRLSQGSVGLSLECASDTIGVLGVEERWVLSGIGYVVAHAGEPLHPTAATRGGPRSSSRGSLRAPSATGSPEGGGQGHRLAGADSYGTPAGLPRRPDGLSIQALPRAPGCGRRGGRGSGPSPARCRGRA